MNNTNLKEVRLATETAGVTLVTRARGTAFENLRETVSSTGEVPDESDNSQTIETITITRKILNTQG
jgi:hypothetical protein